jgi:hypothetical protein
MTNDNRKSSLLIYSPDFLPGSVSISERVELGKIKRKERKGEGRKGRKEILLSGPLRTTFASSAFNSCPRRALY